MKKFNYISGGLLTLFLIYLFVIWKDVTTMAIVVLASTLFYYLVFFIIDHFVRKENRQTFNRIIDLFVLLSMFLTALTAIVLFVKSRESGQVYGHIGLLLNYIILKRGHNGGST